MKINYDHALCAKALEAHAELLRAIKARLKKFLNPNSDNPSLNLVQWACIHPEFTELYDAKQGALENFQEDTVLRNPWLAYGCRLKHRDSGDILTVGAIEIIPRYAQGYNIGIAIEATGPNGEKRNLVTCDIEALEPVK